MEEKHSGFGIASFALSLVAGLSLFALFVVAGALEASTPGGIDEESPIAVVVGLLLLGMMFLELLALGLGIGGLFQANRKKTFAILGIIFSLAAPLAAMALIILGNSVE